MPVYRLQLTCIMTNEFRAVFLVAVTLLALVSAEVEDDFVVSARAEANEFMDNLLEMQLPRLVKDRVERLRDFSFEIPKKLLGGIIPTHRDIQANFSQGILTGLFSVRRKGDCKPVFRDGHFAVISCALDIESLKAMYASSVKGFNLLGDVAHPTIWVYCKGPSLNFEAKQPIPGYNRPLLNALTVDTTNCNASYAPLGFNAERNKLFRERILRNTLPQMLDLINTRLYQVLQDSLRQEGVTLPEIRTEESH
ncbi:hypothetical protein BIW11_07988 [Tropilaelaps mercedesae]|uniref:Secreted protein n=1 Tax=Tropilaelaps mercedesae TaxID=418985 RepID=A0A1V9XRJ8_9ACAR|nr:hypothetical protein BIW11_07988 [Tropilaelaps mercedesae]